MSEWIEIERWPECVHLARPGVVFEIRNGDNQSLFTPCVVPLPPVPFDWKSPPLRFRSIPEPLPRHSDPIPAPADRNRSSASDRSGLQRALL
jgi:hypothetical protein